MKLKVISNRLRIDKMRLVYNFIIDIIVEGINSGFVGYFLLINCLVSY